MPIISASTSYLRDEQESISRNWRDSTILDKQIRTSLSHRLTDRAKRLELESEEEIHTLIDEVIIEYCREHYLSIKDRKSAATMLYASLRGMDIIQELLDDSTISEIMVNGPDNIFYERNGRIERFDGCFESREKLEDIIQKIAAGCNRMVNEANPIVDARLADGSRVNTVLSPIAVNGPILTIRKFSDDVISLEKLIELGAISLEAAEFIKLLVRAGYNIFVSGGTGAGKTTFLNAISKFIPTDERIITIEDSAELRLNHISNLVTLEVRNANIEGNNAVGIRDLIKASLRMRPDRIIVGEVRDAAAIDMLQALNTGHNGMSTGHANSAQDMLSRLETMVLLGTDIPLSAVKRQIASAIDIIIQLGRFRDKSRKITEIVEVCGYENGEVVLSTLFRFVETGEEEGKVLGTLEATENKLRRTEKLKNAGL